ncbi:copper resistance CopC family protein [Curtobacterium flaccumfaciens]|uniref:copper resistance CopC family protein n=1 Tax=Curtobacterium flaccumfaciens TaxID=2035 RepID=UPI00188A5D11|nr:copper resistance CopC family protein [Curtobacterium flaccumfaciens]MBF4629282.1 copper resistance protein CopC [Curtobacterium flaccumfaciens]
MRPRILLATLLPAAVLTTVLGIASPAAAHDALASANPAANSTVAGDLNQVTLTFSEPPLAGLKTGIVISVTGPDGTEVSTGTVRIDGSTLTKPVNLTTVGTYEIAWRSVSVDGHPISGSYPFTSAGAPTPTVSAAPPASSSPTSTAAATAKPTSTAVDASENRTPAIWTLAGITALFTAAVAGILLITRRRPKAPE